MMRDYRILDALESSEAKIENIDSTDYFMMLIIHLNIMKV